MWLRSRRPAEPEGFGGLPMWQVRPAARLTLLTDRDQLLEAAVPDGFQGVSMAEMLVEGPLDAAHAALFCRDLAEIVDALHAQDELHLAISPVSVLITPDAKIRLMHARVARALELPDGLDPRGWHAPELHGGGRPGRAADVYSMGALLTTMLSGLEEASQRPAEAAGGALATRSGHTVAAQQQALVARLVPSADAPAALVDVCRRAMATDPAQRFRSAREFSRVLSRYLDSVPQH